MYSFTVHLQSTYTYLTSGVGDMNYEAACLCSNMENKAINQKSILMFTAKTSRVYVVAMAWPCPHSILR